MFGYVKPCMPRLMVCECDYYKSVYCGLCRTMGKCVGQWHRLCLSYDFAFLCLVRMAILGHDFSVQNKRCFMHPLKKRPIMQKNESLEYCAMLSAILSYHNLLDNVKDHHGLKQWGSKCLLPFASHYRRRAAAYRELENLIIRKLSDLNDLEHQNASPDACADCFGDLLKEVCAYQIQDEAKKRIALAIGFHVGRFIYLCDAADDYEKDKKSHCFNPFDKDSSDTLSEQDKKNIETALIYESLAVFRAVSLLNIKHELQKGIIENIVRLGMPQTAKQVLKIPCDECETVKE